MPIVQTVSASTQSLNWLREQITTGAWPIGSQIPNETALATTLGVGRSTVREAVKILANAGMLEIVTGNGTFVRSTSEAAGVLGRRLAIADFVYVHQARRAIELEAARLACFARTEEDLALLREHLQRRDEYGPDFTDADIAFHTAVVAAAHNPVLDDIFAAILEALRVSFPYRHSQVSREEGSRSHAELIHALTACDPQAALEACETYLAQAPLRHTPAD